MKLEKHTRAQGFTLVELIVVIVILAILATIAFLSFSSQSSSARDSKRKTDLSNLASKINIMVANGSKYTDFAPTTTFSTGYLAGTGSSQAGLVSGDINYTPLGINSSDFQDPLKKVPYKIGASTNAGGIFQLASNIENDSSGNGISSGAFLVGNYTQRLTSTTDTGTADSTASGAKVTLGSKLVGFFKTGDYLKATGITADNKCKVASVSADMATVTLQNCTLTATGLTGLTLAQDEISSIVKGFNGDVVKDGSNPPY